MPSVDRNGVDYTALEGSSGGGATSLPRKMSASGVGSFSVAPGGSGPSSGSASPMNATASTTTATLSTMDAWLVQKLKNEWSSYDLGPLLTRERLSEAVTSFPHLDTPVKVRLLLSFLSMKREEFDESKFAVVEILDAAENDSEDWVRVGAGIVNQYLFMSRNGGEDSGTFLHDQLASASAKVLAAVADKQLQFQRKSNGDALIIEDFFCHENAYLSASVRPELAVQPAAHFTLSETAKNGGRNDSPTGKSSSLGGATGGAGNKLKPPPHRPQMARAHSQSMGLSATPSLASSSSSAARAAPPAIAVAKALPPKKSMSELSSEIRRKADAGRFKRQRNRISVIDIDEVKQIESEKALKAEEQKKRLKAAKDDRKSGPAAGAGGVGLLAGAAVGDKNDGGNGGDDAGDHEDGSGDHTHESQYDDPDDHESDRDDDHDSHYQHGQDDHHASSGGGGGYANDGTQALLHAAFHSTGDVMKEVVSQPYQTQQHSQYHQQQQQQQPLYASRGFEPEDAHASGGGYGGNAYGYGSGYGSHSFGDHQAAPPYNEASGQYANGGFGDDQQKQQQLQQSGRYESSSRERGGFLDGPPEYWR